jgi:hypothetical protein
MEKLSEPDLHFSKFDLAPEPIVPACERCRFWELRDGGPGDGYGFCRRQSPTVATVSKAAEYMARFPLTDSSEWCGEYRPRICAAAKQSASTIAD